MFYILVMDLRWKPEDESSGHLPAASLGLRPSLIVIGASRVIYGHLRLARYQLLRMTA
jgi:hypothetical protein